MRRIDDIKPSASDDLSSRALLESRKAHLINSIFESHKHNKSVKAVAEGEGKITFTNLYERAVVGTEVDQYLAECIGN